MGYDAKDLLLLGAVVLELGPDTPLIEMSLENDQDGTAQEGRRFARITLSQARMLGNALTTIADLAGGADRPMLSIRVSVDAAQVLN